MLSFETAIWVRVHPLHLLPLKIMMVTVTFMMTMYVTEAVSGNDVYDDESIVENNDGCGDDSDDCVITMRVCVSLPPQPPASRQNGREYDSYSLLMSSPSPFVQHFY